VADGIAPVRIPGDIADCSTESRPTAAPLDSQVLLAELSSRPDEFATRLHALDATIQFYERRILLLEARNHSLQAEVARAMQRPALRIGRFVTLLCRRIVARFLNIRTAA